jgi:hypothetical protein
MEAFFHGFTEPIRKKDREKKKKEEEEAARKASEPAKDGGRPANGCCLSLCQCGAEAEAGEAEKPESTEEDPKGLMGVVLKTLGAIAAGIGIVGAVTVVGAGVFWVRFDAIGLPATQAVSAIPKAELLVQGAQEVTIFILVGLAVALVVALCDPKGLVTRGTVGALCAFVVATGIYVCAKGLGFLFALGMVGLAIALALACVAVAFNTGQRQLPLLISVFVASLIFSSSCALLIVHDQKYAQAIAIRFGVDENGEGKGVTGIYVAATDKTIYYGRSGADPELGGAIDTGLYEVARADATTYAVGPLEPTVGKGGTDPTEATAKRLLERLNKDGESFVAPPEEEKDGEAEGAA